MRDKFAASRFLSLLLMSIPSISQAAQFDPQKTGAKFGSGFDTLGSVIKGDCVRKDVGVENILTASEPASVLDGVYQSKRLTPHGQSVTYSATQISSLAKLRQVTNVSASASFSYGIYQGSGRFAFFEDETFDSFSSYMYLSVEVENLTESLKSKLLTESALKSMNEGPNAFRELCGDEFVNTLTHGGTFSAVVKFETTSAEHQKQVSASISGAIAGFGSAEGAFSQNLATLNQLAKSSVLIVRKGSAGAVPPLDKLNEYALNFPDSVSAASGGEWPFLASTFGYNTVSNRPIGTNVEVYDNQSVFLENLAAVRDASLIKRNDLLYVIAHPDQFLDTDLQDANESLSAQSEYFQKLKDLAGDCRINPQKRCGEKIPKAPAIRSFTRPLSSLGRLLDQVDSFYAKRGDRKLAEAGLSILDNADTNMASIDDRYHGELLRLELLLWRFEGGFSGGSVNPLYKETGELIVQSATRASLLSSMIPSHPCEADFLLSKYDLEVESAPNANTLGKHINIL